jgi:hypothetical protein
LLFSTVFTSKTRRSPPTTAFPDIDYRQLDSGDLEPILRNERVKLGDQRLQEGSVTFLKQT